METTTPPRLAHLRSYRDKALSLATVSARLAEDYKAKRLPVKPREHFIKRASTRSDFICFDNIIAETLDERLWSDHMPLELVNVCDGLDDLDWDDGEPDELRRPRAVEHLLQLAQVLIDLAT